MAFNLLAVLALGDAELLADAIRRWPDARARRIRSPFDGIGIATGDKTKGSFEDMERLHALGFDMWDGLPGWSRRHPSVEFVLVEADCFGGTCHYDGFVCRDGAIFYSSQPDAEPDAVLGALAGRLGCSAPAGRFAPLSRGFFEGRRRQEAT